jgi:hypothetical protein
MRRAGQTPHGARPNREGASGSPGMRAGSARHNLRVGRLSRAAMRGPEEWPSRLEQSGGQNSAYRSGCHKHIIFHQLIDSTSHTCKRLPDLAHQPTLTFVGIALTSPEETHGFFIFNILRTIHDGKNIAVVQWPRRHPRSGRCRRGRSPLDSSHTRPQSEFCSRP